MSLPDPTPVLDLIEAFRRSKTMFAALSLGIFDLLEAAPATVETLQRETGADADALARLLDACVSLGLLDRIGQHYANSPAASAYLARSSAHSLRGYVLYSNKALYRMWGDLEGAVREGTHRWKQTFGLEGALFSHFFQTDEAMREFIHGMHGFGMLSSPAVVAAFDLGRFRRMVDLGGATGHLALAACERYPELRAAVFDLPVVIPVTREYLAESPHTARVDLLPGDFFTDPLPEADLFAVGRILHDWSEDKIRRLLRNVYDRLPNGGALLIAERLLDEDKRGPVAAHMQSLNMLVCTEGKERTLSEYEALLREAGFDRVRGSKTGTPLDAILAEKS
ncbi:MAG: class I SAM-dependent methyltransferase [Bryobacteraceae bacterium]